MDSPPKKRFYEDGSNGIDNPTDTDVAPSQVVFVKDLRGNVTEADFHDALSHFGPIAYVMCLRGTGKALVEFENLKSASDCVTLSKIRSVPVGGSPATFQFSKSTSIRRSGLESQQASKVLVLTVCNVLYPITVDVMYQVCSLYGQVQRVALMKGKDNLEVQSLVEFDAIETAKRVKHAINGADIYAGCCTLKVEYSVLHRVNVILNSHDQWDFTLPATGDVHPFNPLNPPPAYPVPDGGSNGTPQPQIYYMPVPVYPGQSAPVVGSGDGGAKNRKRKFDQAKDNGLLPINNGNLSKSPVLMVYGLDVEKFNCDRVFNLLCSYGDCLKVKFLRSMPGTCMAEMKNAEDAQVVIQHLRGCIVFEKELEFTFSRNESLRNPVAEVYKLHDQTPSFKDYGNSRNLRFINPEVAAKNKLVLPTKQLHFFNAPPSMTAERVTEIFENHGIVPLEVLLSRKKTDRSSSGFVTFESTSQALEALVLCNHTPIKEPDVRNPYLFKLAFAMEQEDSSIV